MNTALDVAADADEVVPTEEVHCRTVRYDAGGGGVNVARFARALGASVSAVFTAGGSTGSRVIALFGASGVSGVPVPIDGATRESFTVNERVTGKQYRFVLPGPVLSPGEQARCLEALRQAAYSAQFVVASGSLPPGVPPDFYQRVADMCREAGALLILDTSGGGLSHITSGVYLLKPSVRELRECVGRPLLTETEQLAAAHELIDRGIARIVVVSLGAQGALLAASTHDERFPGLPVAAVSGVGAGDAMVAGITVGLAEGWTLDRAVRYGIAAATAKLRTPGTSEFNRADVERHFAEQLAPSGT